MTNQKPQNIDEYISTQSDDVQIVLQNIRKLIKKVLPGAIETMSYGMPAFKLFGHTLLYFAAWKKHIGLYPLYENSELEEYFKKYKGTKNSVHIPFVEPFPYEVVEKFALLREKQEKTKNKE